MPSKKHSLRPLTVYGLVINPSTSDSAIWAAIAMELELETIKNDPSRRLGFSVQWSDTRSIPEFFCRTYSAKTISGLFLINASLASTKFSKVKIRSEGIPEVCKNFKILERDTPLVSTTMADLQAR